MHKALSRSGEGNLTLVAAAAILLAVVVAYGSNFWPEPLVLSKGMDALGNPPYAGFVGIFVPHLLLYSTVMALVSAALWLGFVRAGILPAPQLGNLRSALAVGPVSGIVGLLATLAVIAVAFPAGTIHWIPPDPWKIAGNVFSNFFEEFVFRGFLLVALRRVIRFWPAAVISSAMWAFTHTQYPLVLQLCILAVGIGFCWAARRARSLWAPYFAHEVLDILGDSLIG